MNTGWSIIVFAIGAFAGLALMSLSPAASVMAVASGALVALILADEKPVKREPADDGDRS